MPGVNLVGTGVLSQELKQLSCQVDHLPPSDAMVKKDKSLFQVLFGYHTFHF